MKLTPSYYFTWKKKYDGVHGTVKLKGSIIEYIPNDGKNVTIEIPHIITTSVLVGDFPMYLVVGCEDGDVISFEFPSCKDRIITHHQLGVVKSLSAFPESHRYLTLIVDTSVMYSPPLPSAITTIEYFYPLCVMLLTYADGRSFVWSLDTGSLLSTLHYSLPQDRVRSTIIYQNQQTKK
ncbi:WD domain containing protein [Entamoeba marina]